MMKLVFGCALATAYVLPFVRLAEAGIASWSAMFVVGAVGIPLVFALVTIGLARTGRQKNLLIRVLLTTSAGLSLAVMARAFAFAAADWIRRGVPTDLNSLASLAVLGLLVVVAGLVVTRLMRGLSPYSA